MYNLMFEHPDATSLDPIPGIIIACAAGPKPKMVDLGGGVRDEGMRA